MQEFIEALRMMTTGDFLRLLALMVPAIAAIWAAFRWAYGERLRTVESNLVEVRNDFDRKFQRELDKVKESHARELADLKVRLETEKAYNSALLADLEALHQAARGLSGGKPSDFSKLWWELDGKYFRRKREFDQQRELLWDSVGEVPKS